MPHDFPRPDSRADHAQPSVVTANLRSMNDRLRMFGNNVERKVRTPLERNFHFRDCMLLPPPDSATRALLVVVATDLQLSRCASPYGNLLVLYSLIDLIGVKPVTHGGGHAAILANVLKLITCPASRLIAGEFLQSTRASGVKICTRSARWTAEGSFSLQFCLARTNLLTVQVQPSLFVPSLAAVYLAAQGDAVPSWNTSDITNLAISLAAGSGEFSCLR